VSRARTLVGTEVVLVAGLLAFVGAAWIVENLAGMAEPMRLGVPLALLLAAIPAAMWLVYFYLQDRLEPEPKHYVLGLCLLGAFCAGPISDFLLMAVFPSSSEAFRGGWPGADHLVRAILGVGLAQEFAKYLVVRYTVYLSSEFDEPMDGIIYMTAAGIGFAAAQNARYFGELGGVVLSVGTANAVVTTMAHASTAGVLGYALGRARFAARSAAHRNSILLVGLLVAATLNGVFGLLESLVRTVGTELDPEPWRGLAFAASFAAVVFAVTSYLMRRQRAAPSRSASPPADARAGSGQSSILRHDLIVAAAALVIMLVGWWAARDLNPTEMATFSRRGLSVSYPAGWFPRDPGPSEFPETVSFRSATTAAEWLEIRLDAKPMVDGALVSVLDLERAQRFGEFYKKFASSPRRIGGREWVRTQYVHAFVAADGDTPQVLHGIDYARVEGDTLYVVTVHAPVERVRELEEDILSSVAIEGRGTR
jgi:RsiW-degrading membrane proteinase PrsW (M82 family)